jgi:hypothetical protein
MKMTRRTFLRSLVAAAVLPALPSPRESSIRREAQAFVPFQATCNSPFKIYLDVMYGVKLPLSPGIMAMMEA